MSAGLREIDVEGNEDFFANGCEPLVMTIGDELIKLRFGNVGICNIGTNDVKIFPTGGNVIVTLYNPKTGELFEHTITENSEPLKIYQRLGNDDVTHLFFDEEEKCSIKGDFFEATITIDGSCLIEQKIHTTGSRH